ncbi:MAG TPA: hypothetical protein VM511_13925, partial [Luteolibacter sp.]|nr:hypothetical protein [Luteolibacter sp.]
PQELVDRIEKEYGLRFKSTPKVHKISTDELRDRISASLESHFGPGGVYYREEAYKLLGWLLPDDALVQQLTAVRSVGARAWFDDDTGEAWVTDKFRIENIPDQAALLRIVTRILLDQNFPPPREYPGDDASRAREALHQGAASASESKYYAEKARTEGFTPLTDNSEAERLFQSLTPFIQGTTTFPAVEGAAYVGALKSLGLEKLHEGLRNPPLTTGAIYEPGENAGAPPAIEMPKVPGDPFMSDSAGELGLKLWVFTLGDPEASLEISSAWKNDRYVFFPEDETTSGVVWDVVLDSKEAADKFQSVALDMTAALAGKEDTAPLAVPVETLEKRFLQVSRVGPDRVRFVNAAKKETAEKLK